MESTRNDKLRRTLKTMVYGSVLAGAVTGLTMSLSKSARADGYQSYDDYRVITSLAGDYAQSAGINLKDYNMKGVHSREIVKDFSKAACHTNMLKQVPFDAVIVDYRVSGDYPTKCSGTALIPKKK